MIMANELTFQSLFQILTSDKLDEKNANVFNAKIYDFVKILISIPNKKPASAGFLFRKVTKLYFPAGSLASLPSTFTILL